MIECARQRAFHVDGDLPPYPCISPVKTSNTEKIRSPAWRAFLVAAGITLLTLFVCRLVVILDYPMGVDQGVFAWIGRVVADGGRPYVDAWDVKGPGVFAVSGFLAMVMPGTLGMRLFDLLLQVAAVAVLARHPIGTDDRRAGWLSAAVYAAGYAALGFHETAQPDSWANALLIIGLVPALKAFDKSNRELLSRRLIVACAAVSFVSLFKPTYGAVGLVPIAMIAIAYRSASGGEKMRVVAFSAMGLALPALACVLWLQSLGALGEMWNVVVRWNSTVYAGSGTETPRHLLYALVYGYFKNVRWWPLGIISSIPLILALRRPAAVVTAMWAAAVLIEIAAQRKFWGYHWTPLLGPMAIAAAFGLADVRGPFRHGTVLKRAWTAASLSVMIALLISVAWGERVRLLARQSPAALVVLESYEPSLHGFDSLVAVVRKESRADDRVLFFGTLAIGNYTTDRASVSRLSMSRPLLDGAGTAVREAYRREFWRDWAQRPPRLVAAYSPRQCQAYPEVTWTCLAAFPELTDRLQREFGPAEEIGGFLLFRRR